MQLLTRIRVSPICKSNSVFPSHKADNATTASAEAGASKAWPGLGNRFWVSQCITCLHAQHHICAPAGLVKSRPLDRWRETLALLCAYCGEGSEFHGLCDLLAKRLAGAGLLAPATLAWICAANVDKAVRQWTQDLKAASPEPSAEALQVNGVSPQRL